MRPLAERVEGIDAVLRLATSSLPDGSAAAVRVAAATFTRIHGALIEYLVEDGQPALVVAEGLVPCWPDDIEVGPFGPLRGAELVPVARAVLAELGTDAPLAVRAAAQVLPGLRGSDEFVAEVTVEYLEALVFTAAVT